TAVMNTLIYVLTTLLALLLLGLIEVGFLTTPLGQLSFLALLTALGAGLAWCVLLRPTLELVIEILFLPMYRVRVHGPGIGFIPLRGPVLIVANHSSYADPFWLGKVLPRALTPMMTSVYFDLPVIRWLMVRVVHGIRVEASQFRRETPDLSYAIAGPQRVKCLPIIAPRTWRGM